MDASPFGASVMARGEMFLAPIFRKARLRSRGDVAAARGRLLMYSKRTPGVQLELIRKAIGQAQFTAGAHAAAIPAKTDPAPFTREQADTMLARVQEAADQAISAADGNGDAARVLLWQAASSNPELAQALAGLKILAL